MPMVLVAGVKNMSKVSRSIGSYQCATIHHASNSDQSFRNLDVITNGVNRGKGAEYFLGRHAFFEWHVLLRIECLG